MKYLLDVNVIIALGWSDHPAHATVLKWITACKKNPGTTLFTSAIPRLCFVRITVQKHKGGVSPAVVGQMLDALLATLGKYHKPLADDGEATIFPEWCRG